MTQAINLVTGVGVFTPDENSGPVRAKREAWAAAHRDHMASLGLQAVFCRTRDDDGKLSPVPQSGVTGGQAEFGVYVMPEKNFTRPAFRLPPNAICLDVDQKPGKDDDGVLTLKKAQAELGDLPLTQRLTAHGFEQGSGRLLYRVPDGFCVDESFFDQFGGAVDVIRTGHRFSMAPGDIHHYAGTPVVCYNPDGSVGELLPVSSWPMLPVDWMMSLAEWNESKGDEDPDDDGGLDAVMSYGAAVRMSDTALDKIRAHDTSGSGFRKLLMSVSVTLGGFVGSLYPTKKDAAGVLAGAVRELWAADLDADDRELIKSGILKGAASPWVVTGGPDPEPVTTEVREAGEDELTLPHPQLPAAVARTIEARFLSQGEPLLISDSEWYRYEQLRYGRLKDEQVETMLYRLTEHAVFMTKDGPKDWNPNSKSIGSLKHALRGLGDTFAETGDWVGDRGDRPTTGHVLVPLQNGIYDVEQDVLLPHDTRWFFTHCLPFNYDPKAQCPTWHKVIDAQWGDLPDTKSALQEWFGYVLSGRTDLQKIGALYGPRRTAKGLIARILQALLGPGGSVGFSLSSLGSTFGMQNLIGAPLAVEGDARWKGIPNMSAVVSRLLKIAGEDTVEIPRKYKGDWSGKLPTRLMILSNDMPEIPDAGGTAASRLLVFHTSVSFYGREDPTLEPAILSNELAGVFNWAVAGMRRLAGQGRFTDPDGAAEELDEMINAGSPVAEFITECCDREPLHSMVLDDLYKAYTAWYRTKNDLSDWAPAWPVAQTFSAQIRSNVPQPRGRQRIRVGGRRVATLYGLKLRDDAVHSAAGRDFAEEEDGPQELL